MAVAVGAVVVVGGESDGGVVGAPVDGRERGGVEGAVGAFGDAGVADVGVAVATLDGGGGAVDAYFVAVLPAGAEAIEDHLAAIVHALGKDLDHAVGGSVIELRAARQGQQDDKDRDEGVYSFHGFKIKKKHRRPSKRAGDASYSFF